MEVGLWGEYELFDQLMQLDREKKKRLASFRANKQSFLFLPFRMSQTRPLLPVALVDLPPSHTQSKYICHCTVGYHSLVNVLPLKSRLGLQFVRRVH